MRVPLTALVYTEGDTDRPVVSAVMKAAGWSGGEFEVFALGGAANLEKRLRQQVAQESPIPRIFIMDSDGKCPVELRRRLMAQGSAATVVLRICHYEIESWILADDQGFPGSSPFHWRRLNPRMDGTPKNGCCAAWTGSAGATCRTSHADPPGAAARMLSEAATS
jgi:hypothetical protein